MSFYHHLAARWSEASGIAIEHGPSSITWDELPGRVARAAGLLRSLGIGRGDVVALQIPRSLAWIELHLGALSIGAVTLPLHDRYTQAEMAYFLDDSHARVAFVARGIAGGIPDDEVRARLDAAPPEPPSDVRGEEIACILYTSGTTGRPKGALITNDNLRAGVSILHEAWRWSSEDVLLHALPLFHVHGLFVAQHGALWAGARTRWMERFDPDLALTMLADATVFMGVPTFYQRFLALPPKDYDLRRVRLFTCGSAGLQSRVWSAFRDRFGHEILERYGMTEVGIVISNPYDGARRPGSIGLPLPGVAARVADGDGATVADGTVGELRIGGPTVFRGYLGQPEKTALALDRGEMRTGDLAVRESDGYIRLVGRARDLVIVGGFNVYPSEIEATLLEFPAVAEAAVVGVPDPDLGERLVASVVLREPAEIEAIQAFCADRLAPYKRPRLVRIVDDFPRNAMGKVEKTRIEAELRRPVVRDGTSADAAAIAARNVAMAWETESLRLDPDVARRGAARAVDHGARYFIAEIAGIVVGQCMVTTEWSDWRDRLVWWLQSVYVEPQWRSNGVYRAMHEHVLAAARAAGAGGLPPVSY
jgi:malonyl-CoA/methylmalonyl-CoA synthetase